MSGGGNSVCRGKMGSKLTTDVNPGEMAEMEKSLTELTQELEKFRLRKARLEEDQVAKEKDLMQLRHNQQKNTKEIQVSQEMKLYRGQQI